MSWDEDDNGWGYNGNTEHDMWVDYTTDVYEDTDYTGNFEEDRNSQCQFAPTAASPGASVNSDSRIVKLEKRIAKLKGYVYDVDRRVSDLEYKACKASSRKAIVKFQRLIEQEREKSDCWQKEIADSEKELAILKKWRLTLEIIAAILILACSVVFAITVLG